MNNSTIKRFTKIGLTLLLGGCIVSSYGQDTYEMMELGHSSLQNGELPNDPGAITNFQVYFSKNTDNPTGHTANPNPDSTVAATISISNQISTSYKTCMGVVISNNPDASYGYIYTPANIYKPAGPTAPDSYTASPVGTSGTGISQTYNDGVQILFPWAALSGHANTGRYKMATVTISLSKPISNPVIHLHGLVASTILEGGNPASEKDTYLDWELTNPGTSFTILSGSTNFGSYTAPDGNQTVTHIGAKNSTTPTSFTDDKGSGSIVINGTNLTEITFDVYIISNTDPADYTAPNNWLYKPGAWIPTLTSTPALGSEVYHYYQGINSWISVSADATDVTLPINYLQKLTAMIQNGKVDLKWSTATELNNKGFDIQRSTDGKTFKSIYFQPSLANSGNSNTPIQYQFTDQLPVPGVTNYYRLNQMNLDDQSVNIGTIASADLSTTKQWMIFPNPASGLINIKGLQPNCTVSIYDAAGHLTKQITGKKINQQIDISDLSGGVYFLKVTTPKGGQSTATFIVK